MFKTLVYIQSSIKTMSELEQTTIPVVNTMSTKWE